MKWFCEPANEALRRTPNPAMEGEQTKETAN
jgi:hypothetical protein